MKIHSLNCNAGNQYSFTSTYNKSAQEIISTARSMAREETNAALKIIKSNGIELPLIFRTFNGTSKNEKIFCIQTLINGWDKRSVTDVNPVRLLKNIAQYGSDEHSELFLGYKA